MRSSWKNKAGVMLLLFVEAAVLLALSAAPAHASWQTEFVEDPNNIGRGNSLKVDSAGRIHIVYGGEHVRYALFSAGAWQIQDVDADGSSCSLALDASDFPSVCYRDTANWNLKLARWGGASWSIEVVDSSGNIGGFALALDSQGYPLIGYDRSDDYHLELARWNGAAWIVETVDTVVSRSALGLSLALDSSDYPAMTCTTDPGERLTFARWDGARWNIETLAGDRSGGESSLAFDALDRPAVASPGWPRASLKFTRWDGSTWVTELIDSTSGVPGSYPSLVFDSLGRALIGYDVRTFPQSLRLARWDGTSWRYEILDTAATDLFENSLALDPSGYPIISYLDSIYDDSSYNLKLARWDGAGWHSETVDRSHSVGRYPSLAFSPQDFPEISYYDSIEGNLRFAVWDGTLWNVEVVDSITIAGLYTSLAFSPAGQPAISYADNAALALKLARWDGSAWNIEFVDASGDEELYTSLAFSPAGDPAISYCNDTDHELRLARWSGSTWNIEILDSSGCRTTSLASDPSGNPAVSYTGNGLRFAHWNGTTWTIEILVSDNSFMPPVETSLAFDPSGHPTVSSHRMGMDEDAIVFAQWDGSMWNSSTVWFRVLTTVSGPSHAFGSDGYPAVTFSKSGELAYYQRQGSDWVEEIVDGPGLFNYPSLAFSRSGYPGIAYYDWQRHALKYAHLVPDGILRGETFPTLIEVAREPLPWTDSDPVLTGSFPPLLFYRVDTVPRIVLRKAGASITIFQ
jgi:hypothetical protein